MLPSIPVKFIRAGEVSPLQSISEGCVTALNQLCAGKVGVIDLWHTKCSRCPAALEKLNETIDTLQENPAFKDVLFLTIALSQGPNDVGTVQDLLEE